MKQVVDGDKRVTKVGRFLRRNNLDERPQLVNLLMGEMSLLGPRPHAVAHYGYYAKHLSMYRVRLGVTGWTQINGYRGPTPKIHHMPKRIEHDLFYITDRSNMLDF